MSSNSKKTKWCDGCEKFLTNGGFLKHLNYARNAKCLAKFHGRPWPPVQVPVPPVQEPPVNGLEAPDVGLDVPMQEAVSTFESDNEHFPVADDPESPCVNTPEKRAKRRRRYFSQLSPVKTRATTRSSHNKDLPKETEFAPNDNLGDCSDDENIDNLQTAPDNGSTNEKIQPENFQFDTSLWDQFEEFADYSANNRMPFEPHVKASVELMSLLSKKRVP